MRDVCSTETVGGLIESLSKLDPKLPVVVITDQDLGPFGTSYREVAGVLYTLNGQPVLALTTREGDLYTRAQSPRGTAQCRAYKHSCVPVRCPNKLDATLRCELDDGHEQRHYAAQNTWGDSYDTPEPVVCTPCAGEA